MRATLLAQQGVGLAAPQVGLARRVVLVERQDRAEPGGAAPVDLLLNPRLTWRSEALVLGWEGCLSVPGWRGEVARAERVRVAWERLDGPPAEEEVGGWTARILQHEIDHLDGVLYVDRVAGALVDEATYQERKRAAEAGSTPTPP
jgi:peptide deformylase